MALTQVALTHVSNSWGLIKLSELLRTFLTAFQTNVNLNFRLLSSPYVYSLTVHFKLDVDYGSSALVILTAQHQYPRC